MRALFILLLCLSGPLWASEYPEADVYLLGELHDNPHHHRRQAAWVQGTRAKALVFEMVPAEAAEGVTDRMRADKEQLLTALDWWGRGADDAALYLPIFEVAPDAALYGALVDRDAARAAMVSGVAEAFGAEAALYGLDRPLPKAEQTAREAHQLAAHCDALPDAMLPTMVSLQRLRDAALARAIVTAQAETGGPVAVITGNGHARKDWGIAPYLRRVAPELRVFSLGQGEVGSAVSGVFDVTFSAPAHPRGEPCDAFKQD